MPTPEQERALAEAEQEEEEQQAAAEALRVEPRPIAEPEPLPAPVPHSVPVEKPSSWADRLDIGLATTLLFMVIFVLVHRGLTKAHLDRGIAMFIGLPAVLGMFVASSKPRRPVTATLKYLTLAYCLAAPPLGEGAVCLFMSMPITYPIAALIAWLASRGTHPKALRVAVLVPFLHAMLNRTPTEALKVVEVEDAIDIPVAPAAVWRGLEQTTLPLHDAVPLFLRLGFPTPRRLVGEGLFVGAERRVEFDNGVVVAKVVAIDPGRSFRVLLSYRNPGKEFFDRFLVLDDATFVLEPIAGGTRFRHVTHYRRLLDPELYFGRLEEHGVHVMQRHLLERFRAELLR